MAELGIRGGPKNRCLHARLAGSIPAWGTRGGCDAERYDTEEDKGATEVYGIDAGGVC